MNLCTPARPVFAAPYPPRFDRSGILLGFAFGGFFDGILLHQVLQWHHLLSGLSGPDWADLRVQVVADGLFHALMYVLAVVGLWQLFGARAEFARPTARRRLMGSFWMGFGAWHVADALLSHWLLGIHRIRMDTTMPLAWDLGWLLLFGVVPYWIGRRMRRTTQGPSDAGNGSGGGHGSVGTALLAVVAVTAAGALHAVPLRAQPGPTVTVVLRPGVSAADWFAALDQLDARVLWSDPTGAVWVLRPAQADDGGALRYYRHGALYVSGTLAPAGCAAYLRL
ncbi:DUF2243 domain-containing protein [Bordetella sp. 2513F-2]